MIFFPWLQCKEPPLELALPPTDPNNAPTFDFSKTPLANDYPSTDFYVKVLEGVFTPKECRALIRFAETGVFDTDVDEAMDTREELGEKENPWKQAGVNYGIEEHQQIVDTSYRNSERILRFDKDVSGWVSERIAPYIKEVVEIKPGSEWESIVSLPGKNKKTWKLVGLNERLSFLKYSRGHFFKEHCDGQIELPDGRKSRITVQVYLKGGLDGEGRIVGGATRIWSRDMKRYVDIEPRIGRVLVFQQRGVLHTGEEVKKGVKYAMRSDLLFRTEEQQDGMGAGGSGDVNMTE
ncbi:hypothetical protein AX17_005469 [Amanita inopinata Kibby_2008]|nr:hypothetical protein AX17_005469 [Amanita inopinata Kibby_2008]